MSKITAEYITHSGDDLLVVNSARVSMGKESAFEEADIEKMTKINPRKLIF